MREHKVVEIEYQKEVDAQPSTRLVEPYSLERQLPNWYVHTWDRSSDAERSFRLDRMKSAKLTRERFTPREAFEPTRLAGAHTAPVLYAPEIARWAVERGARRLADGSALRELPVGSDEWLESEILAQRGAAVVLGPPDVRARIAARAKQLAKDLGVERLRARA
jgi:predicted DNA-binding transcriptional regulator YafY